ncbi:MAG: hypothetical protein N3E51_01785 [Candidatus Micrarchaeota archaeon]|nr:hypothetical protein [Candidatus Micrarchaeota archaeon]
MWWEARVPHTAKQGNDAGRTGAKGVSTSPVRLLRGRELAEKAFSAANVSMPHAAPDKKGFFSKAFGAAKKKGNRQNSNSCSDFSEELLDLNIKAPLQWYELADMAKAHYLKWLAKRKPDDEEVKIRLEGCKEIYAPRMRLIRQQGGLEAERALMFLKEAKRFARRMGEVLIAERKRADKQISILEKQAQEEIAEICKAEELEKEAAKKFYRKKDAMLAGFLSREFEGADSLVKVVKCLARYAEYLAPLLGGTAAFLAGASPEAIGAIAAAVGISLKALKWHLSVVRTHIPRREAKRLECIMRQRRLQKEEVQERLEKRREEVEAGFSQAEAKVTESIKKAHARLCQHFEYVLAG